MMMRSACSVNRRIFFIILVGLLFVSLFSTMSAIGVDAGGIEGDCKNGEGTYR